MHYLVFNFHRPHNFRKSTCFLFFFFGWFQWAFSFIYSKLNRANWDVKLRRPGVKKSKKTWGWQDIRVLLAQSGHCQLLAIFITCPFIIQSEIIVRSWIRTNDARIRKVKGRRLRFISYMFSFSTHFYSHVAYNWLYRIRNIIAQNS